MKGITKGIGNKVTAVLTAALLAFGAAACGSTENGAESAAAPSETSVVAISGSETPEPDNTSDTAASETAEGDPEADGAQETAYPVEITDSYGDVITLEREPERVVSVAPNLTELMYKLDAADKLVGRSDYCDYPEEALAVESVGSIYTPDIEKIVSLEPDVVIVSTHFDEENAKKLEDLNIPVITLYEEHDVTGVYEMIEILGTAINRNEEALACVEEMRDVIAGVTAAVEGLDAPSVYYVVGYGEYGDYTAGGDTFIGGLISLAGGDNIAKDVSGWSITLEEIVEADPSIIVTSETDKDGFMADENYADLTAVKEGKVYTIDTNMLDRQGYRNADGVRMLAEIFHPEAIK